MNRNMALLLTVLTFTIAIPVHAGIIVNGGFESGLAGWTRADQAGSDGTFFLQTGTTSPVNNFPVPAPPEGNNAAMTDAQGPGSHLLYQDIVIPNVVPGGFVVFSLFINNTAADFITQPDLDFATPALNQQARVDILDASGAVLMNLYQTDPGDPLVSGYTSFFFNISSLLQANAGQTLRLQFAEVDNVNAFNFGVDAVDLTIGAIPEPSTWILMVTGAAAVALYRRRHLI